MRVHPSQAERVTTWFRDDCSCPVLDPDGDGCALSADFTDGLCSHCHGHALDAARSPEPGLREALLRYGAKHEWGCTSSTLGPDPRCVCGLSALLSEENPDER